MEFAAPNQGSAVAKRLVGSIVTRTILGPSLATLADTKALRLLPSLIKFATVAGTKNTLRINAQWGDGLVGVAETHLAGEQVHKDFNATHTYIMSDADVIAFTTEFITGR